MQIVRSIRLTMSVAAAALLCASAAARAQSTPKFDYGKAEAVKNGDEHKVEWKVQAKGGALLTTGNSESKNATAGLSASRKEGNNKLAIDGGLAYGRSNILAPVVDAAANTVTLDRQSVTTTNNWLAKGRYDRFFTANNAGYASGQAAADQIAGKTFYGGGQIGYSRQLISDALQTLVVEVGYDFSYERYVSQPMKTLDPVNIHSARAFVGDKLKLSTETGLSASVEALFNLNKEGAALDVNTGTAGVDAFKDTRVNGQIALTTTLYKKLSIGVSFAVRYDQNPAPRPMPAGAPAGATFAPTAGPNGVPFSDKTDTQSEATLVYTFL